MKRALTFAAGGLFSLGFAVLLGLRADEPATRPAADPTREPPAEFVLETPGGPVEVVAGRPFDLTVAGQTVRATLRPADTKKLDVGDLSFRYPTNMAFEYEAGDAPALWWFLDGNDALIMLQKLGPDADEKAAVKATADASEAMFEGRVKRKPAAPLRLGDARVAGTRLEIEAAKGVTSLQDIYGIRANGVAYVLMLQDSPDDPADMTADMRRVRQLLADTWKAADDARR